jgi:imidazole glycerol-phosphate synthase subunit HisF
MTLKTRVIPIVLWDGVQAVQTTSFGARRRIGSLSQILAVCEKRNLDELIVLDIEAHKWERPIDMLTMQEFSSRLSMPLTMGGGIVDMGTAREMIKTCCDKVVLRSIIKDFKGPFNPIHEMSKVFGSQAVVVACDVFGDKVEVHGRHKRPDNGEFNVAVRYLDPVEFCRKAERCGAGEIILTSVNHQGKMRGYDLPLILEISRSVNIPVIANGGCGSVEHMAEALRAGAHAVAGSTVFHHTELTPFRAAKKLAEMGFNTRVET